MEYYGEALMRSKPNVERMAEPSAVAHAVRKALQTKRPKARYTVGRDARFYSLCRRILPDFMLDWIVS
jgi:hypothetical protein